MSTTRHQLRGTGAFSLTELFLSPSPVAALHCKAVSTTCCHGTEGFTPRCPAPRRRHLPLLVAEAGFETGVVESETGGAAQVTTLVSGANIASNAKAVLPHPRIDVLALIGKVVAPSFFLREASEDGGC